MNAKRHISFLFVLLGLLVAAPCASASSSLLDDDLVRITTIGGDSLSVKPGGVVTVVYKVESDEPEERIFIPSFELPEGWMVVIGQAELKTNRDAPTVRFVTYRVPKSALSANYQVKMNLRSSSDEPDHSHSSTVFVEKIFSFTFDVDNVESHVPAGAALQTRLYLSNHGNTPITAIISAKERKLAQVDLPGNRIRLEPGESREVESTIHTDGNLERSSKIGIRYDAFIEEDPASVMYKSLVFEVIPVYNRVRPKAANLPLSLSLETVGDETGFVPQAKLAGTVNALGGEITVQATLSENPRQKFFGSDQFLAVEYRRKNVTVKLGDHSQQISPLTMIGEQGMGAAVEVDNGNWNVKTSAQRIRHSFPAQEHAGFSVGKRLGDTSSISANMLHRSGLFNGKILSIRGQTQPFGPTTSLDVECGITSSNALSDPSCVLMWSQSSKRWSLRFRGHQASSSYPGAAAGLKQLSEYSSIRINSFLRFDSSINWLNRDLGQGYSRSNSFVKAGLTFSNRIKRGTFFATTHGIRSITNYVSLLENVDRSEQLVRAAIGYHLRLIGMSASIERGSANSFDTGGRSSLQRIKTSMRANLTSDWSVNASYEISTGNLSALNIDQKQAFYGLGTNIRLPKQITVSATAFRSQISTSVDQQYSSFRTQIAKSFRRGKTLMARAQFSEIDGRHRIRSADYSLSYSMPLALPFGSSRNEDTVLRGRVRDGTTGKPVPGALIFLGDYLSISDKDGRFAIPRKLDSAEYLRLDQKSIGFDRIPSISLPLLVQPEDFSGTELVLTLSRSATLDGRVEVWSYPGISQPLYGSTNTELELAGGLAGVVIQIASSTHRYRTRTDRNGSFHFGQLPEGDYTVSVVSSHIKEYQKFEQSSHEVTVDINNSNSLLFKVIPVKRDVRIIKSSTLSLTPEPASGTKKKPASAITPSEPTPKQPEAKQPAPKQPDAKKSNVDKPTQNQPEAKSQTKKQPTSEVQDKPKTKRSAQVVERSGQAPSNPENAPSGNWLDLMKESAKSGAQGDRQGAATIPFYIELEPTPIGPSYVTPVYVFMLILSVLFYLVSIELIIRNLITNHRAVVRSIGKPAWIWAYRQTTVYAALIAGVSFYLGPLGGFSIALALAGVSLTIESKEQYKNIGAILYLLLRNQVRVGAWIAYQEGVGQVTNMTLQSIRLTMHSGKTIELCPAALLHVSISRWKPDQVRNETMQIRVSRTANLREIRHLVTEELVSFAPPGTRHHTHIQFKDLDETVTAVCIETVVDGNSTDTEKILKALNRSLTAHGIETGLKTKEKSSTTDKVQVEKDRKAYPPLRLVKRVDDEAA